MSGLLHSTADSGSGSTATSRPIVDFILESIPSGVIAVDRALQIRYANRAARLALDLPDGDLSATSVAALLPVAEHLRGSSPSADSGGGEARYFARVSGPSGSPRRAIGYSVVRPPQPRTDVEAVVLLRGMDDVQLLEDNRRRAEQIAALGRMVAGLAHEVRNPLASLRALTDGLLAKIAPGDDLAEYATRALEAVLRIEGFVRSAVRFAQIEVQPRTRIAAVELLAAACAACSLGPSVSTTTDGDPATLACDVDRSQIVACLTALLTNAVEAASAPSRVQLHVSRRPDSADMGWIRIAITDDGPGIPAALSTRVFEPFYSTKPARTGMGLAFAQGYAHENGGHVELAEGSERGSTFLLWLPEAP